MVTQVSIGSGRGWLAPEAAASLARVDARLGRPLDINSAGRTFADQQSLWDRYYNRGDRTIGRPAKPGTSLHESGLAIDTDDRIGWIGEHGFVADVAGEPWHFRYRADLDRHKNGSAPAPAPKYRALTVDNIASVLADCRGLQKIAKAYGYAGKLDNQWGPRSKRGFRAFLNARYGGDPVRWLRERWGYSGDRLLGPVMSAAIQRANDENFRAL